MRQGFQQSQNLPLNIFQVSPDIPVLCSTFLSEVNSHGELTPRAWASLPSGTLKTTVEPPKACTVTGPAALSLRRWMVAPSSNTESFILIIVLVTFVSTRSPVSCTEPSVRVGSVITIGSKSVQGSLKVFALIFFRSVCLIIVHGAISWAVALSAFLVMRE